MIDSLPFSYPVAYTIVVLPVSVARWTAFNHPNSHIPDAATFFTVFLHNSFGAVNVLLLLTTRPNLLLFVDPRSLRRNFESMSTVDDMERNNGRAPSPSDNQSVASIRTAEEMRENHTAAGWAAGTGGVFYDESGDPHWRQPNHEGLSAAVRGGLKI